MSKSLLYVANTATQSVPVGGNINLGGIIRRFGCAPTLSGDSINVSESGYYDISVSVTTEPTAIGNVAITLLNNGVTVPGATASGTVAAANTPVNLSFESVIRVFCGANTGALTLVLSDTASNVTNVAVVVKKV